jgi:hypothetical protein
MNTKCIITCTECPGRLRPFRAARGPKSLHPRRRRRPGAPVTPAGRFAAPFTKVNPYLALHVCAVAYERYVGQNKPGAKQAVLFTYGTVSWMQLDIRATPAAKNGCCIALLLLLLGDFHPRAHTHTVSFLSAGAAA